MNQDDLSPKILVAPLDWGLGHATRCIPIVRELLRQNCTVILAASGKGKKLLQQEFPHLSFVDLPGYEIEYASTAWGLAIKIVAQIPKLLSAIKGEQAWLQKLVAKEKLDAVISDNRYGLHHPKIYSVFITHQLSIKAPLKMAENVLQQEAYKHINRFDECWVPDAEGEENLAGELSHPLNKPAVPLYYTGPLSRIAKKGIESNASHLLIFLSGPEPQRTLLENLLLKELKDYTKPVVFVRGLPGEAEPLIVAENIIVYNHLSAKELEQKLHDAFLVISRCGYSTVMDLVAMQKRSVLIPTPGQTEQEYLAKHLMRKNFALCVEQKKFRLKNVLTLVETFPYQLAFQLENHSREVIERFVETVKRRKKDLAENFI